MIPLTKSSLFCNPPDCLPFNNQTKSICHWKRLLDDQVSTNQSSDICLPTQIKIQSRRRREGTRICGYGQDVNKEEASESMVIGAIDICFVSKITKSKLTGRNHSCSSLSCRRPCEVVIEKSALQLGCSRQC